MSDCLFCKITRGEFNTPFLYESPTLVAFRDLHPKAPSHILFVPKAHYATLNDIPESEATLAAEVTHAIQQVTKTEGIAESGYRVITNVNGDGGQEIYHLHVHVLGGHKLGGLV